MSDAYFFFGAAFLGAGFAAGFLAAGFLAAAFSWWLKEGTPAAVESTGGF
jgi:hypothetical protein